MRILLASIVVLSGCVVSRPDDAALTADLACETARMVVGMQQQPSPQPANDKCENCNGTGKIGDGRIVMTCPVCKGTGKKLRSVLKCENGACRP